MARARYPTWLPGQGGKTLQAAGAAMLRGFTRGRRRLATAVHGIAAALVSPALISVALVLAGTGLGIAGVFVLWGRGPALLATCCFCYLLAGLIARGGGNA